MGSAKKQWLHQLQPEADSNAASMAIFQQKSGRDLASWFMGIFTSSHIVNTWLRVNTTSGYFVRPLATPQTNF